LLTFVDGQSTVFAQISLPAYRADGYQRVPMITVPDQRRRRASRSLRKSE
jgi:hypothetical protein